MYSYKTGLAKDAMYYIPYLRVLTIVFGVVALIFGEFTPIIVWIFGTSFLPGTCITQAQLDNRRRRRMDDLDRKRLPITPRVTPTIEQVNQLPRRTIMHECRYLPAVCLANAVSSVYFQDGPQYTVSPRCFCARCSFEESIISSTTTN